MVAKPEEAGPKVRTHSTWKMDYNTRDVCLGQKLGGRTKIKKKIIFVHGYTASSRADWYPAIKPELDRLGIDYSIPDLPGGENPHSNEWVEIIKREVELSSKPVVLVGHSLGTRAVLLYLDKYQKKADTVVLIAPLSNDVTNAERKGGTAYPDFFEYKIDLQKVKKLAKKFVILHSKDDSSLDYEKHGLSLARELGAKLITFEGRDHFSHPENAFYVLEVLRRELDF
jgi:predicted alpha/beta hydrolase family esterase